MGERERERERDDWLLETVNEFVLEFSKFKHLANSFEREWNKNIWNCYANYRPQQRTKCRLNDI